MVTLLIFTGVSRSCGGPCSELVIWYSDLQCTMFKTKHELRQYLYLKFEIVWPQTSVYFSKSFDVFKAQSTYNCGIIEKLILFSLGFDSFLEEIFS